MLLPACVMKAVDLRCAAAPTVAVDVTDVRTATAQACIPELKELEAGHQDHLQQPAGPPQQHCYGTAAVCGALEAAGGTTRGRGKAVEGASVDGQERGRHGGSLLQLHMQVCCLLCVCLNLSACE